MSNRLKGKWALVTGASSGFGAETARQLADMGVNLLLGARREDRLGQVAAECLKRGAASAHIHKMDVTRTASVNAFADWAKATAGRVDVLVNNAGGAHGVERVEDGRDEDWEAMGLSERVGRTIFNMATNPEMADSGNDFFGDLEISSGASGSSGGSIDDSGRSLQCVGRDRAR